MESAKLFYITKKYEHSFENYLSLAEKGHVDETYRVGYCYDEGVGVAKDNRKAFDYYRKSAEMDHVNGTYKVGYCYSNGIGVKKDEHIAFKYYQKSAEMGDSNGIFQVGYCYLKGIGVKKDEHKSFKYFQKSAEMGDSNGIFRVGHCYLNGFGVEKDEHRAFKNYKKSAEMGFVDGMYNTGYCYLYGLGIEKDERKAFEYFQKSSEMGHVSGTYNMSYFYLNGVVVEKDEHKAFEYYKKSADMGDATGTYNVGQFYFNGIGVEKDEYKAFEYFQKSAEMDYVDGVYNVGCCYVHGTGVKKDQHKAIEYFKKSVVMGSSMGARYVAHAYSYGVGVEKDEHKAFEYCKKSAEMGHLPGISTLARFYRDGFGVTKNLQMSMYWYQMERDKLLASKDLILKIPDVDDKLKKMLDENGYLLLWIPYNEIEIATEIGRGGYANVYGSVWDTKFVALKLIRGSRDCNEEFMKELKAYCDIGSKNPTFLRCHGISRDVISRDYILVMDFAEMGSLRINLPLIAQMKWENKLELLISIASDLQIIHSQNIIHRDLHSGNILLNSLESAYIADLGLSISIDIESKGTYGVLPYIAPEVLNGIPYTLASDIYSFGIIMWEISSGKAYPFKHKSEESRYQFQINVTTHDFRESIIEGTPRSYINLMKRCWDGNPKNRPRAEEIYGIFTEWQNDAKIKTELTESDKILHNVKKVQSETYPEQNYSSEFHLYSRRDSQLDNLKL